MLFKTVVQLVMIFGMETWVMNPHIGRALGGIPTKVCTADHREVAPSDIGRDLVPTSTGDGDSGSKVQRDGGLCAEES